MSAEDEGTPIDEKRRPYLAFGSDCPKCGNKSNGQSRTFKRVESHPSGLPTGTAVAEFIAVECTCGFAWNEPTKDQTR